MPNEIYHRSNFGNPNAEGFGDVYYDHAATNKLYNHSDYYENSDGTDATLKDLNNKASIVLTPTAYSDGSLNTVIPPYGINQTELITNGDFNDGSTGWTHNNLSGTSTFSVSNNELTFTRDTFGDSFYQTDVAPAVAGVYLLTFDITAISGGSLRYSFSPNSAANTSNRVLANSLGSYSTSFVSDGTLLDFVFDLDSNGASVTIDNVSVKKIQEADFDFSRGSSATRVNEQGLVEDVQILSGELVQNGNFEQIGAEEVTNGNFETDSDWTKTSTVTISNEVANIVQYLAQSGITTQNKFYKLVYTIVSNNNGALKFSNGSTSYGGLTSTAGTHTKYFKANTGTSVYIERQAGVTDISIDNVSVKEVGQNWTPNTNATLSIDSGRLKVAISGGSGYPSQNITTEVGKTYKVTADAFIGTSSRLAFWINADSQFRNLYADGSFNFTFVATSTSTQLRLYVYDDGAYGFWDNVSVVKVTNDTDLPRIDFTDGTGSLLLEPQRTNTFVYSEDYSQTNWSKNQITVSGNNIVSPDGSVNASLITISSSIPYLAQFQTLTTGNNYTISAFVKKGTNRWVRLAYVSSGSNAVWFDLENNVVGTQVGYSVSASIENYGNGWYRIINTITSNSSSGIAFLGLSDANNGTSSTSGIGNTVYAWGLQVTQGDYPTSYIPTSGSTVTRSQDVANNSGNADLFNDSEGVLYYEASALNDDVGSTRTLSISDGSGTNTLYTGYNSSSNVIQAQLVVGGVAQTNMLHTVSDRTDFLKVAILYQNNNHKMYINGVEVLVDTSGSVPSANTFDRLNFDLGQGSFDFYGNVKCVAVFKEALSNDLLERLTGEGYESFRLLAEANNYTII